MQLIELEKIISNAGGGANAIPYAPAILEKIQRIEKTPQGDKLLRQFRTAKEPGDLRGRLLEVNFADHFLRSNVNLEYGVKQGMRGDIDFCWRLNDLRLFFEVKQLGEAKTVPYSNEPSLKIEGGFKAERLGTDDIVRLQRALLLKSSTKKFNPVLQPGYINFVVIDVSELQIGTVDVADCLLAAGGNPVVLRYCGASFMREDVVGFFEKPSHDRELSSAQLKWITEVASQPDDVPHPRDYIHGSLFLFRMPAEKAALSYELKGAIVWNTALISDEVRRLVSCAIHQVIPRENK